MWNPMRHDPFVMMCGCNAAPLPIKELPLTQISRFGSEESVLMPIQCGAFCLYGHGIQFVMVFVRITEPAKGQQKGQEIYGTKRE